jgi:hypothetical protein
VIGVPSYFKEEELKVLTEAAALIGLKIDNFVPEPIAALLAYGMSLNPDFFILFIHLFLIIYSSFICCIYLFIYSFIYLFY